MGEAVDHSFSQFPPEDIRAIVAYLRSVPAIASNDLPATPAPPAPASHRQGHGVLDPRGKMVFEGACASCHGWTGVSPISPFATLTGARAVNDPSATNVAQIVISGTRRHTDGAVSMPAFGAAYSDAEIAAVANYVTARFGAKARGSPRRMWRSCASRRRSDPRGHEAIRHASTAVIDDATVMAKDIWHKTWVRDPAARGARAMPGTVPLGNKREQGRPGARCTRGLACKKVAKKRTRAYRFSGGSPAFPAQWFYDL